MSTVADPATPIRVESIAAADAVPEHEAVILLYLRKLRFGYSMSLEYRGFDLKTADTFCLLSRRSRTKTTAIQLATELAIITKSRSVYVVNEPDDQ